MIPKIIHQIWVGDRPIPWEWINSWKTLNPDWTHILWGNRSAERLFADSKLTRLFDYEVRKKLNDSNAAIADYLRLEILARHGGLYVDADTYCIRPIPDEVCSHEFVTCYLNENERPGRLSNGVMGCQPQHPLIQMMIDGLRHKQRRRGPSCEFAGPVYLTECAKKFDIKIYPSRIFLPYFLRNIDANTDLTESICVHLWGTTNSVSGRQITRKVIQAARLTVSRCEYDEMEP